MAGETSSAASDALDASRGRYVLPPPCRVLSGPLFRAGARFTKSSTNVRSSLPSVRSAGSLESLGEGGMASEAQHASPSPGSYPARTIGPLCPQPVTRSNGNPLQQPPGSAAPHTVDNVAHRTSSSSSKSALDSGASAPQQRHLPPGAMPGPRFRKVPGTEARGHPHNWSSSVDSLASNTRQVPSSSITSAPQPHGFYRHSVPAQASPAHHRDYSMRESTNRQSFRPYPDQRGYFPRASTTMHPSALPPRPRPNGTAPLQSRGAPYSALADMPPRPHIPPHSSLHPPQYPAQLPSSSSPATRQDARRHTADTIDATMNGAIYTRAAYDSEPRRASQPAPDSHAAPTRAAHAGTNAQQLPKTAPMRPWEHYPRKSA